MIRARFFTLITTAILSSMASRSSGAQITNPCVFRDIKVHLLAQNAPIEEPTKDGRTKTNGAEAEADPAKVERPWENAYGRLFQLNTEIDPDLANFDEALCKKAIDLTFLLFLKRDPHKRPDIFDEAAYEKALAFKREHATVFETKTSVDAHTILALILVESRMGMNPGKFPLLTALLAMAASDRKTVIDYLVQEALLIQEKLRKERAALLRKAAEEHRSASLLVRAKNPSKTSDREGALKKLDEDLAAKNKEIESEYKDALKWTAGTLRERFNEKTRNKVKWALAEVRAVISLEKKWPDVLRLKTSYAAAFGMPQFLPSSFKAYAISARGEQALADLYKPEDVIVSVDHYLLKFGWDNGNTDEERLEAQRKAIWGYNHSWSYVDLIQKTAKILETKSMTKTGLQTPPSLRSRGLTKGTGSSPAKIRTPAKLLSGEASNATSVSESTKSDSVNASASGPVAEPVPEPKHKPKKTKKTPLTRSAALSFSKLPEIKN